MAEFLGHELRPEIKALWNEVKNACDSKGYGYLRKELRAELKKKDTCLGGCDFSNSSIRVEVRSDIPTELFNLVFGHELSHAVQLADDYPRLALCNFGTAEDKEFANHFTSQILDIDADRRLREKVGTIELLGLYRFDLELGPKGTYKTIKKRIERKDKYITLILALDYMRMYFEYSEDPDISDNKWKEADTWFKDVPEIWQQGQDLIKIIEYVGLDNYTNS